MTNVPFRGIEDFRDIETLNHYAEAVDVLGAPAEEVLAALRTTSRDNARTPVQWSDAPNAGFTTGTPWIPVNPNFREVNAAAERRDPDSVFAYYRSLIDLRHHDERVSSGTLEMVLPEHPQVFAYTRTLGRRQLLVLVNLTGEQADYELPDAQAWAGATTVLSNLPDARGGVTGTLAPWQALVLSRDDA